MYDEDWGDYFDNDQQQINNYFGAIAREERKNKLKNPCTMQCIYSNDCPHDWDLEKCNRVERELNQGMV